MITYRNPEQFYKVLYFLSQNEHIVQKAWEYWNNIHINLELGLLEGDCVVLPDFSIQFCKAGTGYDLAKEKNGWLLYEHEGMEFEEVIAMIEEQMDILEKAGHVPDDIEIWIPGLN